jgi:peptidoglycan-N-acetylglucosamine deacetylase
LNGGAARADCDDGRMRATIGSLGRAVTWFVPAPAPMLAPLADALRLERKLPASMHGVALTFDDGPHREGTPATLELLRDAGARATFFLVGEQVDRYPELAAEIAAAGHEIGLHGYQHFLLLRRTVGDVASDLDRALDTIVRAAGQTPSCYRPPYGVFSAGALEHVRRRGWRPVLWSKWGRDWTRRATPASIVRNAVDGLAAGDVVLLHDADHYSAPGSWQKTIAALPRILDSAKKLGLPWVPLTGPR